MLILGRDIGLGNSIFIDLKFNVAVVTLSLKILSRLYLYVNN